MNKEYQILLDVLNKYSNNLKYDIKKIENNVIYFNYKGFLTKQSNFTFNLNTFNFYQCSYIHKINDIYEKELIVFKRKLKLKKYK